ncbi:hypothetical protein EDC96DRAFT_596417 [Choanephora cucurbitarum]|nr:hypothetical protein EDC96DRAFT_596417 [Choanephora cucurbitarum]
MTSKYLSDLEEDVVQDKPVLTTKRKASLEDNGQAADHQGIRIKGLAKLKEEEDRGRLLVQQKINRLHHEHVERKKIEKIKETNKLIEKTNKILKANKPLIPFEEPKSTLPKGKRVEDKALAELCFERDMYDEKARKAFEEAIGQLIMYFHYFYPDPNAIPMTTYKFARAHILKTICGDDHHYYKQFMHAIKKVDPYTLSFKKK